MRFRDSRRADHFRKTGLALLLLAHLAGSAAGQTGADLPSLLQQIADQDARLSKLLRNSTHTRATRSEELDKKGKVESTTESIERVTSRDGISRRELVRFVRDGRDVTDEEKKRRAEREAKEKTSPSRKKRSITLSFRSPFTEEEQPKYRFSLVGPDPTDPRNVRIRFEPKGRPSPDLQIGEAVADPEAGTVLRMRYQPSDNPNFMDRMETEMDYGASTPVGPALSRLTLNGTGGILFIKKRVRMTSNFSDYTFEETR